MRFRIGRFPVHCGRQSEVLFGNLEPAERARFVAAIADAAVRAEVESLLAADADGLEQNLEHAISETAARGIVTDETQPVESEISHYRLLELLGSGGIEPGLPRP